MIAKCEDTCLFIRKFISCHTIRLFWRNFALDVVAGYQDFGRPGCIRLQSKHYTTLHIVRTQKTSTWIRI